MKQVIFVGWVRTGKPPVDGETAKNQHIIAELKKYCRVTVLDFYQKSRHPWIYVQALWALLSQPKATIIFSTSAQNVYSTLKLFKMIGLRREIIHWVVGGSFGKHVQEGRYSADVFNYVKYNLVQCHGMIEELERAGITNARFVSNFKPIPYCPNLEQALDKRKHSAKMRFVFLSRIMPSKGCDYMLEAIRSLNAKGLQDLFVVDFYGKIDREYRDSFIQRAGSLDNVNYLGLLDLRHQEGYDTLATYHVMVFPTIHPTEGFSGIFIDAFIAGLPILASRWAYNAEFIHHGKLGMIYPSHDAKALADCIEDCILGKTDLYALSINARNEAVNYQSDNVITKEFLKSIGLVEK